MKNIIVFLCFLMASTMMAQSAQKRLVVGFIPFTGGEGLLLGSLQNNFISTHLYNLVTTEFINSHRVTNIELNAFDMTKIELERQKGEGSMFTEIKRQGISLNADVLVFGAISMVAYTKTEQGEYAVTVSYGLKYIHVETGEVKHALLLTGTLGQLDLKSAITKTAFDVTTSKASTSEDQKKALESAKSLLNTKDGNLDNAIKKSLDNTQKDIAKWVKIMFPLTMRIKSVEKGDRTNKEDPTKYYIVFNCGKADGIPAKMRKVDLLFTKIGTTMDNQPTSRDIVLYELKVESVQEEVTVCTIKIKEADGKPRNPNQVTLEERIRKDYKYLKGVETNGVMGVESIFKRWNIYRG